jgi:hypothetical protein
MRVSRLGLVMVGALLASACDKDAGPFLAPTVPLAYTRFINAIPDTVPVDFRYIDLLEYSPFAIQLQYRQFTPYQGTAPGARQLRVFTNWGGDSVYLRHTTVMLGEETPTFEAGKYYTLVATGFSRTGQTPGVRVQVFEDPIPDPGSNVAFRVVNLGAGMSAVDVGVTAASADAIPAATFSNVPYLGASQYVTRPTGNAWFRVTAAGGGTELVSGNGRQAPPGIVGDPLANLTTVGGSGQAGSVVTAYLFPPSVAGSRAPSITTPSLVFVVDKHPR